MSNEAENILIFYKEIMEEMRERRRIEWQTFIVVNFFYLSLLSGLQWFSGSIQLFQAIAVTLVIVAFSWIWFIRIYGNAARFRVNQSIRNNITGGARFPYKDIIQEALKTQNSLGCPGWREKKKKDSNWPFFGYRGSVWLSFYIVLL